MSEALYETIEIGTTDFQKISSNWRYRAGVGSEAERTVAKKVLVLLDAGKRFNPEAFHALKDEFLALYADDPRKRAEVVSLLVEYTARFPIEDGFPEKAMRVAAELVASHPAHPESHLLLATLKTTYRHEGPEGNLKHYVACLKLESTHEGCRRGYGRLVDQLTAPRCSGDDLRSGMFLTAAEDKANPPWGYVRKLMFEGTLEVYVTAKPTLHFESAKAVGITKDGTVFFFPNDEAIRYLDGMRTDPHLTSANLVVVREKEVLAAVRIAANMSTNPVIFLPPTNLPNPPSYEALTKRFCKKTTKRELAADLRL